MSEASYLEPVISSAHPLGSGSVLYEQRALGCLHRKSEFGKLFKPADGNIKVIPRSRWDDYETDLRPMVKTVLDQGSVGSCATEATAQAIMIARAFADLPHVELNPWFIYSRTSDGRDRGSSIDENLRFVQRYGCAPVSAWGRDKGWKTKPSVAAHTAALDFADIEVFDISSVNEMVSALLLGMPVVYGANGHAVVKVKHFDADKGIDINSWGTDWREGGFGVWASYRAVNFAYGAFAVRAVR